MKLVCFDMDNTLVKSDKIHIIAFNKAFQKNNLPKANPKNLKNLFGTRHGLF